MTIRILLIPGLFAGMLALLGCERQTEAQKADANEKKTISELLVGKWKKTSVTPGLAPDFQSTCEFTASGKLVLWSYNSIDRVIPQPQTQNGTYRVEGNLLFRTLGNPGDGSPGTITEITDLKLVIAYTFRSDVEVCEYMRVSE